GLLPRVQIIPLGKGMAGLAAEQRQPVQICNLQHHDGSLAQPAARQTGMEGSIAVPMLTAGRLHGVLGVAKPIPYTYSEPETALLLEVAAVMGKYLGG
ncbi:MAG: GAF domain-containing protein, partial [Planctomycetes bacterium]|nr:GAF domain-containing protein [Planctomycetota bacterium]